MLCDGRDLPQRGKYAKLYDIVKDQYGKPAEKSLFKIPDYRGYFLRGLDTSGMVDLDGKGRQIGSVEQDSFARHSHVVPIGGGGATPGKYVEHPENERVGPVDRTMEEGGNETRPKNIAVNWLIKY